MSGLTFDDISPMTSEPVTLRFPLNIAIINLPNSQSIKVGLRVATCPSKQSTDRFKIGKKQQNYLLALSRPSPMKNRLQPQKDVIRTTFSHKASFLTVDCLFSPNPP
ncbi:hypothetical protein ACQKDS_03220 [Serratia sp. NPDC078593]|uniref:hypothetical protein n=1 Tax=unclassified Serratia (in: enterobacteria) TaxID=2647522 RepID=UPI0037CD39BD